MFYERHGYFLTSV